MFNSRIIIIYVYNYLLYDYLTYMYINLLNVLNVEIYVKIICNL